jgi:hypothetical protein
MAIIATIPSPARAATPERTGCMMGLNHRVNVKPSTTSAAGQKIAYRISHIHLVTPDGDQTGSG